MASNMINENIPYLNFDQHEELFELTSKVDSIITLIQSNLSVQSVVVINDGLCIASTLLRDVKVEPQKNESPIGRH